MVMLLIPVFVYSKVLAEDPVATLQRQIDETNKLLNLSVSATKPLESEVKNLADRIKNAEATISSLKKEQLLLTSTIAEREAALADQYTLFAGRVASQYRSSVISPILTIFFSNNQADFIQKIKATELAAQRDRQLLDLLGVDIIDLQTDKQRAQEREKSLANLQVELDKQRAFFEKEIAGAKAYQAELSQKIAALTAEQQKILAAKTGTTTTSVGEVPEADDPASRADYNPGFSPAFALFSFGAPHYKGMSQYGAFGRAKSGQNYEAILKAYYGDVRIETTDMPGSINVSGVGSISFEDKYLLGIAEMPGSWGDQGGFEALKAQAIAARTYALAYTGWRLSDRSVKQAICATEACQVYKQSKVDAGGKWHEAVRATKGQVLVGNGSGEIFSTLYASTSGGHQLGYSSLGHSTPSVWDSTSDWSNWVAGAYEKIGGSPWFYKGWYRERSGDSCGRSHPWLNSEEMADILNGWVVRRKGNGDESSRVSPLGSCWGGNPYSLSELRSRASAYGEEYTSVSGARVEHSQSGSTSTVILQTNRGEVRISGSEFKEVFNLRAPGRIAIKGKLFSIEKK